MRAWLLIAALLVPISLSAQAGRPRKPAVGVLVGVQLGPRLVSLPSETDSFPLGLAIRDTTHEGANDICMRPESGRASFLLVLKDEDLGLDYAALTQDSTRYLGCPSVPGSAHLQFDSVSYDLTTSIAGMKRRLGPPSVSGDTLRWVRRWRRTVPDEHGTMGAWDGWAGLEVVQRAGRVWRIAVWRNETS